MSYPAITFSIRRPLLSLQACAAIADQPVRDIVPRIQDGQVEYAFNIALRDSSRPCLRVLAASLAAYLAGEKRPARTPAEDLARIAEIFPRLAENIQTDTVARLFGTDKQQVSKMVLANLFKVAREGHRGRTGSALISRRSCIEFLAARRWK